MIGLIYKIRYFFKIFIRCKAQINPSDIGYCESGVQLKKQPGTELSCGCSEFRRGCTIELTGKSTVTIGSKCFFNRWCTISAMDEITIGDNTLFGEGVKIFDHDHEHVPVLQRSSFTSSPIIIGDNCWLASNVIVLKGVRIGDNVTVAAGTVVRSDIPSNSIAYNKSGELQIKPKSL